MSANQQSAAIQAQPQSHEMMAPVALSDEMRQTPVEQQQEQEQQQQPETMRLRGGGVIGDCIAAICCFEICKDCCC